MHRRERSSMREGSCPQRRRTPSFSSTLLDSICRSIDESKTDLDEDQQLGLYNETTIHTSKPINFSNKYNHSSVQYSEKGGKKRMNLRQAVMLEDWMEKQQSSHSSQLLNSSSSSSECSSGGVFSSSETDTSHNKQRSIPKIDKPQKKHVKNTDHRNSKRQPQQQQQPQREGGFARTKLRALKIYDELNQKVKQPISPGSRIATFLSSIFNSHNVKKAKMCYVGAVEDVTIDHKSKSPCFTSSASSISRRSCMSKTPSSAKGNKSNNNGIKRSVKFYPVSLILGEDPDQPSSHNFVYESDPSLLPLSNIRKVTRNSNSIEELKNTVMAKENGAEVAARRLIKGYKNSGKVKFDFGGFYDNVEVEDDAVSYSSSDLFELDHLIGAERYQEELPVYETTNLETNKAIANAIGKNPSLTFD